MVILIAEDFADTRLMIKMVLEMKGHRVVEAANGREAVEIATRERPHLILMDLNMPVMDGIAAAERLREQPETAMVPTIAVTAHCRDAAWRERALQAGCVECVRLARGLRSTRPSDHQRAYLITSTPTQNFKRAPP
jgi:CheY-like chemotaxis protein